MEMEIEGLHLLEVDLHCACLMQQKFQNSNLPDLETRDCHLLELDMRSYHLLGFNPLPRLFKALLHGQKHRVFLKLAFKCIGQQERFRAFRPAWNI
jgi:hypothetical protein